LPGAVDLGLTENPNVTAAMFGIDVSYLQVKVNEGALLPTVTLQASAQQAYEQSISIPRQFVASGVAQLSIPIYQGGAEYAATRQAKESLSQQEIQTDSLRNQVRQAVVAAWGLNEAAVGVVRAARAAVSANEVALTGVREEAKVGQRTTLDVLNAQQALLQARTTLVQAEHDQVVDSYQLLSAIGRLNIPTLGLAVAEYDPRVHFDQVKSKWIGLRTPSGQ
jgi:outer membrane protein